MGAIATIVVSIMSGIMVYLALQQFIRMKYGIAIIAAIMSAVGVGFVIWGVWLVNSISAMFGLVLITGAVAWVIRRDEWKTYVAQKGRRERL